MIELNKSCAEAMGWRQHGQSFHVPDGTLDKFHENLYMRISDMHFHDSYDWAMLLVKLVTYKVDHGELPALTKDSILTLPYYWCHSAEDLSQACLEVLK